MTKKSKYDMSAVQNFAFGGIANPSQQTMIRGSDKQYFDARQKELDAFEAQRVAYNDSLTKWQNEVYTPYKAQIAEYNTAVDVYNAGPRTTDYTGPAMPTPGREFDGTAPTVPFKEEDVKARQQAAAMRARNDAAARATAIDVASDPSRFNFGSMSVSNRFMAEGGEVTQDDSGDRAARSVIKDFESYGYTKKEIMALADEVAAAGRGGDELLAYLSPESVELLKANGGSGTINPTTGLREFWPTPILGDTVNLLKQVIMEEQAKQAAADKAAAATAAELEAARVARVAMDQEIAAARERALKLFAPPPPPTAEELLKQTQERDRMIATPVIGTNRTPVASIAQPSFQNTSQFSFANSPSPDFSGNASAPQSMVRDSTNSYAPVNAQNVPSYSSRGVGAISSIGSARDMATNANRNLSPVVLGSTQNANSNLSPTMLGGAQNAGFFTDRLGNQIYAPGMGPVSTPRYAKGGDVDLSALLAQNTETMSNEEPEEATNTNPVGTAQKMLADLGGAGQASPTRQAVKRVRTAPGGGATSDKAMQMAYEALSKGDLSAMKDVTPGARNTDSARAQMEELARIYQMKIRATQEKAKGLSADFFGAPTLEGQTLTKGRLTKKRFKDGGEAKKAVAESAEEPSIFSVSDYATKASARMFPEQMGQDDERDAARHMLAAAVLAKKTGPSTAVFLGKAHERMSNPESFFSMLGIGKPRDDYEMDVHNNRVGADLGSRATSQAELEKLVAAMAMQSQNKQVEGKPWTMSKEQMKNRKGQVTTQPPEYRAEGSPEEGEESLDKYYAPKARPSTGLNRKQGPISQQLNSGEAYVNMAKGVTELPYDIAGAPVDLATMLMRPFGYSTEKPVMGSDFIKEKMTKLGVRPEPPADPTAKGFYTAGELLSNLTNPAGVTRAAVKGAKKTGEAATAVAKDFQEYNRQLSVPGASYAARPTGSTMLSGPVGLNKNVSEVDQLLQGGMSNAKSVAGQNAGQEGLIKDFWDKKARNYFMRQFGTPDDPIAAAISKKQLKGSAIEEAFPEYMLDQIAAGKTRVKEGARPEGFVGPGAPEGRFFPKYPRAMEDFTKRYDQATGLKGNLLVADPATAIEPGYNFIGSQGRALARGASEREADKMIQQGVRPEMINNEIGVVTRSIKDPTELLSSDATSSARDLYAAFEESSAYKKMNEPQKTSWINKIFGEGRNVSGMDEADVGKGLLSENVLTAIQKGEPVYDVGYLSRPLKTLFKPESINTYLASLPPRELANIRFEDAVRGGLKMSENAAQLENIASRIKSGKPVADAVFSKGVSAPLLQIKEGPLDGFAWKRIEKREATVPEGAYVGHSVGGYETGGAGYTAEMREGFNTGKWQVYTLRDNRNRPVNTVEVKMLDEVTPVVRQIKGNGRASGNVPAEKYDTAVLDFFKTYLKPAAIEEDDKFLTPLLKAYKAELDSTKKQSELDNLYRDLGLD